MKFIAKTPAMLPLGILAALAAATTWATASLMAHRPARELGAIEFTRVQLIAASCALAVLVTLTSGWALVDGRFAPAIAVSSIFGVVMTNLAMSECLRRGGPLRTQLLLALHAPIAGLIAFFALDEMPSRPLIGGAALMLAGVVLATLFGRRQSSAHHLERVEGSLGLILVFGLSAATSQAIGLVAIKPAMLAGLPPLTASALRILGAAWALSLITLVPLGRFSGKDRATAAGTLRAIVPGLLGYVVASTLLLFAVRHGPTAIATSVGASVPVLLLPLQWIVTRQRPPALAWGGAFLVALGACTIAAYA